MTREEEKEFAGKNALITGGARNIGFAIAKELALRGASVALADLGRDLPTIPYPLCTSQSLEKAMEDLGSFGTRALGLVCDVRNEGQVQTAVSRIVDQWGSIDILVNNGGVISLYPIAELSQEAWDVVVDVCLKGAYLCSKHVLPHMITRHYGKIINIASIAGLRGLGLSTHYCAAKHGLLGFTKALAMEVANHNIHVNAVCPGTVIDEPRGIAAQTGLEGEPYGHFSQGHLFQDRRIAPEDIACDVRWLASAEPTGALSSLPAGDCQENSRRMRPSASKERRLGSRWGTGFGVAPLEERPRPRGPGRARRRKRCVRIRTRPIHTAERTTQTTSLPPVRRLANIAVLMGGSRHGGRHPIRRISGRNAPPAL